MDDSQAAWQPLYAVKDAFPLGFCTQPPLDWVVAGVAELVWETELAWVTGWVVVTGEGLVSELGVVPGLGVVAG